LTKIQDFGATTPSPNPSHLHTKTNGFQEVCCTQKNETSVVKGHNQPASDGGNNVLEGEWGRLMTGPMRKAFIETTTVVVAFTWGACTGIIDW
jgi:hypothetical protein